MEALNHREEQKIHQTFQINDISEIVVKNDVSHLQLLKSPTTIQCMFENLKSPNKVKDDQTDDIFKHLDKRSDSSSCQIDDADVEGDESKLLFENLIEDSILVKKQ